MEKGIIKIFTNIQCNRNNHVGLESTYFGNHGYTYIGKSGRTNNHIVNFCDIFSINDLNSRFSEIIVMLDQPNYFGGVLLESTKDIVTKLSKFTGKISFLCNDPNILPINAARHIHNRFNVLSDEIVNDYEKILYNGNYIFPGKDIFRFFDKTKVPFINENNIIYYDYFKEIFKNILKVPDNIPIKKQYDLIYYGDNRKKFREKELLKYMSNNHNNVLVGFKCKSLDLVNYIKKQKHSELLKYINNSKVSLILGDKEHYNNVVTFRFYEVMCSTALAAIPINFDPNKELIKNEYLKKVLYVSSKDDVDKLVKLYSPDLLRLQHLEYKRIMKEI